MLSNHGVAAEEVNSPPKILLVDDEPRILRSLKAALKNSYEIHTAVDGQAAQRLLKRQDDFSVIVSDERMPNMRGHELLTWSKKHYPSCARILMTGYSDMSALQNSINNAEIFKYIPKPWKIDDVKQTINHALIMAHSGFFDDVEHEGYQQVRENCVMAVLESDKQNGQVFVKLGEPIVKTTEIFDSVETLYQAIVLDSNIGVAVIDTSVVGISASIALTQKIKESHPYVSVIIVTTAADGGSAIDMLNTGQILKYLVKPISTMRMSPVISAAVDSYVNKAHKLKSVLNSLEKGGSEEAGFKSYWRNISSLWHWRKPTTEKKSYSRLRAIKKSLSSGSKHQPMIK